MGSLYYTRCVNRFTQNSIFLNSNALHTQYYFTNGFWNVYSTRIEQWTNKHELHFVSHNINIIPHPCLLSANSQINYMSCILN